MTQTAIESLNPAQVAGLPGFAPNTRPDLRAPFVNDDITLNLNVGNYWRTATNLWVSARSTAGAAVWQPVGFAGPLLGDAIGVAPIAAYGTRKVVSAWTGMAFQVIRASDSTTKDIGFVGNVADAGSLQAFLAGTTGKVTKWYDQSGGAFDAVQTTDANRPVVSFALTDGAPVITTEGYGKPGGNTWLNIPTGLAVTRGAVSAVAVAHPATDGGVTWALGQAGEMMMYIGVRTTYGLTTFYAGNPGNAPGQASDGVALIGAFGTSATLFTTTFNDDVATVSTTSASLTGGRIGATTFATQSATPQGSAEWQAFIVWPTLTTTAQIDLVRRAAYRAYNIQPQRRSLLLAVGDSITFGYKSYNDTFTRALAPTTSDAYRIENIGQPSATTDNITANQLPRAQQVASLYPNNKIAIVWAGTNNIALNSESAATANGKLATLCQTIQGYGYKVVVVTMLPRSDVNVEATRQTFNATIRSGYTAYANAIADVGADPTIGVSTANADTTLYADGIHPTPLGNAYVAPTIRAAVLSVAVR